MRNHTAADKKFLQKKIAIMSKTILNQMVKKRMNTNELSVKSGVNYSGVWRFLHENHPISVNGLYLLCRAVGLSIHKVIPPK